MHGPKRNMLISKAPQQVRVQAIDVTDAKDSLPLRGCGSRGLQTRMDSFKDVFTEACGTAEGRFTANATMAAWTATGLISSKRVLLEVAQHITQFLRS